MNPLDLSAGFRGSGLYPLCKNYILDKVIQKSMENANLNFNDMLQGNEGSPHKLLQKAIISAIAPLFTSITKSIQTSA